MNTLAALAKSRAAAKALNNPKGHPKDKEKGRTKKVRPCVDCKKTGKPRNGIRCVDCY